MGHKVHPKGIRLGITQDWTSKWYANKKDFKKLFHQDLEIEKFIIKTLATEGLADIEILRTQGKVIININTAKPGLIIGRGGEVIEKLKESLNKKFKEAFAINVKEIKNPMVNAAVVAEIVAGQVEKRVSYRRVAKMSISKILESGALGAKIYLGGRLNGVEISRGEYFSEGKIPLHTLRADIDYCSKAAFTPYGKIGIKVWIYKGEVFKKDFNVKLAQQIEEIRQS